jgi:cytoskeletal protein CcmA (bactofilin family)
MWGAKERSRQAEHRSENFTLFGKGTDFKGVVTLFDGTVRVDGRVEGEIHTTGTVIVGEHAVIEGIICAGVLMNSGTIIGNVTASEKVVILKPGTLVGDIRTPVFAIEEGSHFQGMCNMAAHHWRTERILSVDLAPGLLASAH